MLNRSIDFTIVGAQKAGTTTLYHYLDQHPDIFLPKQKESNFFACNSSFRKGYQELEPIYRSVAGQKLVGHAYVNLLYFTYTATRLREFNPQMRIIAVFRNPIERAYSAYWHARRDGIEVETSFEEALSLEQLRKYGGFHERAYLTYVGHGFYYSQIVKFIEEFGTEQVKMILTEDLKDNPIQVRDEIYKWLELSPIPSASTPAKHRRNSAKLSRWPALTKTIRSRDLVLKQLYQKMAPKTIQQQVRELVVAPILAANMKRFSYPPMKEETEVRLRETFHESNSELGRLIQRDVSFW